MRETVWEIACDENRIDEFYVRTKPPGGGRYA
jgi:hypothetical protein